MANIDFQLDYLELFFPILQDHKTKIPVIPVSHGVRVDMQINCWIILIRPKSNNKHRTAIEQESGLARCFRGFLVFILSCRIENKILSYT